MYGKRHYKEKNIPLHFHREKKGNNEMLFLKMATTASDAMSTSSSMKERRRQAKNVIDELIQSHRKLLRNYQMIVANGGEIVCENGETLTKPDATRAMRQFENELRALPSRFLTRSKRDKSAPSKVQFCTASDQFKAFLLSMAKRCGLQSSDIFVDEKRGITEKKNLISNLFAIYNLKFSPSHNLGKGKTQSRVISGDAVYDALREGDSMFTVNGRTPDQSIKDATSKPGFYEKTALVSKQQVNRRDSPMEVLAHKQTSPGKAPIVSTEVVDGKKQTVIQFGFLPVLSALLTAPAEAWFDDEDFDRYNDRYHEMVAGLTEFKESLPNPKKKTA